MEEEDIEQKVLKSTVAEVLATEGHADSSAYPCVVCLDAITERAVAVPCGHELDYLCLISWLDERSTCPLCKTEVSSVKYDWKSSQEFKAYRVTPKPRRATPNRNLSPSLRSIHDASRFNTRGRLGPRASRRQQRSRPHAPVTADAALLRRRLVYRNQLYSLHVGSNRLSRFRVLTPATFSRDEELVSRARNWIRRELQVFEFLNPAGCQVEGVVRRADNAEFLLEYIVAILKTVNIKGSGGQAEDMLQEFLGRENTTLFLHELRAWLRSPYTSLDDWDRHVQYSEGSASLLEQKPPQTYDRDQPRNRGAKRPDGVAPASTGDFLHKRSSDRYVPCRGHRLPRQQNIKILR